jgi:glycosyltransferase involved in cell wall biosynthesis
VPQLMGRASLHCCPSRPEQREAFGNVVVEAKASGVPSIVTPSGDLPDLVRHKVDGWVCAAADARSIADGVEYFFSRPDALAAAGRAARASSAAYGEDRFASAWAAVFASQELEHSNALC